MNKVTWFCDKCDKKNVDLRLETALPMCVGCEKQFDWDELVHLSDDCDAYMNKVDKLSRCRFGKAAVDLVEETDAAVHSLQDSFSSYVKIDEALNRVRKLQAKELWSQLGEVPVNQDEEIEEPFLEFEKGADRYDIWKWFEESFQLSIAKDLMFIG